VLFVHGSSEYDDFVSAVRDKLETGYGRVDRRDRLKHAAKTPDLDAQTSTVRFVDEPCAESAGQKHISCHIGGPRFSQRTGQRKKHSSPGERN
jgi:hypothetical protein